MTAHFSKYEELLNKTALMLLPSYLMQSKGSITFDAYTECWKTAHKFLEAKIKFEKNLNGAFGESLKP